MIKLHIKADRHAQQQFHSRNIKAKIFDLENLERILTGQMLENHKLDKNPNARAFLYEGFVYLMEIFGNVVKIKTVIKFNPDEWRPKGVRHGS